MEQDEVVVEEEGHRGRGGRQNEAPIGKQHLRPWALRLGSGPEPGSASALSAAGLGGDRRFRVFFGGALLLGCKRHLFGLGFRVWGLGFRV